MRGPTMTKKTIVMASAASAALLSVGTMATPVTFVNQCSHVINLYDNKRTENLNTGATTSRDLPNGFSGMFRHGTNPQANLLEFSVANGRIWYDISAIPPGPGYCTSHAHCKEFTKKSGFNIAVSMEPQTSAITNVCKKIVCEHEACADAYLFPKDDTKTRSCPDSVPMKIVFCPSGNAAPVPAPAPTTNAPSAGPSGAFAPAAGYESGVVSSSPVTVTPAPAPSQPQQWTPPAASQSPAKQQWSGNSSSFAGATLKSSFSYTGAKAGSGQGTYGMVTNTKGCVKETVTVNSPVGPLSEEVSMVFRGPMDIYNIAVFDGSAGGDWKKVSSYSQSGETDNMVFLNNKNVDYVTGVKSPQGLSSKDGLTKASSAQQFSGYLAEATNPSKIGGGPGISTGAEVNIMTSTKCSADGSCKGYYDDNGYHGWNGGKKMFVTKVKMPWGAAPNQPAIWMLNAQVLRANQYGCNCRGMGAVGGCGELDIAEVIETNNARDKVTTHYYFYDGKIAAGGDNFAPRPTNAPTTYITIIDSDSGTIKILEIGESDFDFAASAVASSQISAWINAPSKNLIGY